MNSQLKKRPAVFFDRDGVLNVDHGYTYRSEDFDWIQGSQESILALNKAGYFVFVITNQSGVARGYYTEKDVQELHEFMNDELAKVGAHIDQFYYCPHHPEVADDKYGGQCQCRKPRPGMILKAIEQWPICIENSIVVGDKVSDIQAAKAAGVKGLLFEGGNLFLFLREKMPIVV